MSRLFHIVAFGGGTGLPVLLAGLRDRPEAVVTAVVTVADDGGSSGRLRRELGVAPPGDIRACLLALARDDRLAGVFDHRFSSAGELDGHPLGNLIVAGLAGMSGDLVAGVESACRMLDVRGEVYPAACDALTLELRARDGAVLHGESAVAGRRGALARVEAVPPVAAAPAGVLAAIARADAVVLSAGSLYTSTIAALLGTGTREALGRFRGPVLHVANLSEQSGETGGLTVAGHVRAIAAHAGPRITDVLVAQEAGRWLPGAVRVDDRALARLGVAVHRSPLLGAGASRHDPARLAAAVLAVAARRSARLALTRRPARPQRTTVERVTGVATIR